jgi:hypothetical protein
MAQRRDKCILTPFGSYHSDIRCESSVEFNTLTSPQSFRESFCIGDHVAAITQPQSCSGSVQYRLETLPV